MDYDVDDVGAVCAAHAMADRGEVEIIARFIFLLLQVKLVAIMGGFYPTSNNRSSFNFNCGQQLMGEPMECGGKSYEAVLGMPPEVRMVFSGFEVGLEVQSGAALSRCVPRTAAQGI